jgi:hypothetical protein
MRRNGPYASTKRQFDGVRRQVDLSASAYRALALASRIRFASRQATRASSMRPVRYTITVWARNTSASSTAPRPGYLFGFGNKRFCRHKAGLMGKRYPELVEDVGARLPGRRLLQRGPVLLFGASVVAGGKQDIAARHGGLEQRDRRRRIIVRRRSNCG